MNKINGIDIDVGYTDTAEMPDYAGAPQAVCKAVNYIIFGLLVDGGFHKQWCLEKALQSLGVDLVELRETLQAEDFDWEDGVAP